MIEENIIKKYTKTVYIYAFRNKFNGKVYIGQTKDTKHRYQSHLNFASSGKKDKFHTALREEGIENFDYIIFEEKYLGCEEGNNAEIYGIALFESNNPECGYNYTKGGGNYGGTEFLEFTEARSYIQSLGLKPGEWETFRHSKDRPNIIPKNPNRVYVAEWISTMDWLGNNNCHKISIIICGIKYESKTEAWRILTESGILKIKFATFNFRWEQGLRDFELLNNESLKDCYVEWNEKRVSITELAKQWGTTNAGLKTRHFRNKFSLQECYEFYVLKMPNPNIGIKIIDELGKEFSSKSFYFKYLSEKSGLDVGTIRTRYDQQNLRKENDLIAPIKQGRPPIKHPITYQNKTQSAKQWGIDLNIPQTVIYRWCVYEKKSLASLIEKRQNLKKNDL